MKAFERVNHAITELPPKSANIVFAFINELFEKKLDKELLKQKFWSFNSGEQHYICYYLKIYFNSSDRYTFFNKWIIEKEYQYSKAGEEESFIDFKEEIYLNKSRLADILISYEKTASRRLKQLKKHKIPFDEYSEYFHQGQINYKIPLQFEPNKFKVFCIKAMSEVMPPEQAKEFFYNSFDFGNNLYPTKLLYIELSDLTLVKEQISLIKDKYDESIKYPLENAIEEYNDKIDKLPAKKQKAYSKLKNKKTTLEDFAKIMYNAFPEVRDKAAKKNLEKFLKTYGSNLLIRK